MRETDLSGALSNISIGGKRKGERNLGRENVLPKKKKKTKRKTKAI